MLDLKNREGFWYTGKGSKLPKPIGQSHPWRGQTEFLKALTRLESGVENIRRQKGFSRCRICKCINGSTEFWYKTWRWPSGFKHYVKDHNVRPSTSFTEFVLKDTA